MVIAVPARDETGSIDECLRSLDVAAARCSPRVAAVLAADTCTDDTVAVARRRVGAGRHIGWRIIEGRWASASRARAAAILCALGALGPTDLATVWIANTDADCTVPDDWLMRQLAHAATGADALAGTVRLDPATTSPELLSLFDAGYRPAAPTHPHVHAANFGVRADVYLRLGGWSPHTMLGEEHAFWRRLRVGGFDVRQPSDLVVTTSSRTVSRVRGGFASALARMADRPPPTLSDQSGAGRSRLGSLVTTASYDSSMASRISSSGMAPPTFKVFQPERPM